MKKVLSLVLVLTLVLGSFSMAFAAEAKTNNLADINGNANEGAIVVANDLGVVTGYPDGTFKPDNAVTRAEFAAMMTRALDIPESALKGFKTSSFKDVAADHWAVTYLGYCNSKGIMTGYEDGTARPNQTITVNEAMTMICRAIGYTNQAKELVGAWPANYISLAQQLDLYDDVKAVATVDRASAAQIVYNALPLTLMYIDADGVTTAQTGAPSMLKNLGGAETNQGEGYVLQSDAANKAVVNVHKYVGSFVKTWNDKNGKIIAVEELSTTMYGKYKVDTNGNRTFTVDGVDYSIKTGANSYTGKLWNNTVAGSPTFAPVNAANPDEVANGETKYTDCKTTSVAKSGMIENGAVAPFGAQQGTKKWTLTPGEKYTLAVDLDGKTINAIYSINRWDREGFSKFKTSDLKLDKQTISVGGKTYDFPTDKNNEIDYTAFVLEGVASLDKIAVDNVVEVFTEKTTNTISKISVGTETVEGTVEKINKDGDITLAGKVYSYDGKAGDEPQVGDTGLARLNYAGDIVYWEESASISGNYAVLIAAKSEAGDLIGGTAVTKVGLCLKDGTLKEFTLTDSAKVANDNAGGTTVLSNAALSGKIVTYSLDSSSNKITKITVVTETALGAASTNNNKTAYGGKELTKDTVVFLKDNSDWSVGSISDFDKNKTFTAICTVLDTDGKKIKAISVNKDDIASADDEFGVITDVWKEAVDGTTRWFAKGFIDGKEFSYQIKDSNETDTNWHVSMNDALNGGLYKLTVDSNKVAIDYTNVASKTNATATAFLMGKTVLVEEVTDINYTAGSMGTITVSGAGIVDVAKDAVVYIYDKVINSKGQKTDDYAYRVGTVEELEGMIALCVSTTGDSKTDKYATVILAWEK